MYVTVCMGMVPGDGCLGGDTIGGGCRPPAGTIYVYIYIYKIKGLRPLPPTSVVLGLSWLLLDKQHKDRIVTSLLDREQSPEQGPHIYVCKLLNREGLA